MNGEPYVAKSAALSMERFAVKRGLVKSTGGNAGLAKLATTYFENINVDSEGVFTGSYGLLVQVQGSYDSAGKLAVEVEQMKGDALGEFLESDGGREKAMESRRRWSSFLDEATGYNAKQRGDKAKEEAKKFSKAKSAIKMAHKSMQLISGIDESVIAKANELIQALEEKIEAGEPPSETQVKKLNDLF